MHAHVEKLADGAELALQGVHVPSTHVAPSWVMRPAQYSVLVHGVCASAALASSAAASSARAAGMAIGKKEEVILVRKIRSESGSSSALLLSFFILKDRTLSGEIELIDAAESTLAISGAAVGWDGMGCAVGD